MPVKCETDSVPSMSDQKKSQPTDYRRLLVLLCAVVLLSIFAATKISTGVAGTSEFVAAATGRVGLVMAALWLAWPSLKKPARWLPPGVAVLIVGLLVVLAAQPRNGAVWARRPLRMGVCRGPSRICHTRPSCRPSAVCRISWCTRAR